MKNLAVKTQSPKGDEPKYKENLGCVTMFQDDENYIVLDAYQGFGDSYKKRKTPILSITIDGNPAIICTFKQLGEMIKDSK